MVAIEFDSCEILRDEKRTHKRTIEERGSQNFYDLHMLMLKQGCWPEELRCLLQSDVDLERKPGRAASRMRSPIFVSCNPFLSEPKLPK
jgi:hypothetical protein